jgi:hypothetical protein
MLPKTEGVKISRRCRRCMAVHPCRVQARPSPRPLIEERLLEVDLPEIAFPPECLETGEFRDVRRSKPCEPESI